MWIRIDRALNLCCELYYHHHAVSRNTASITATHITAWQKGKSNPGDRAFSRIPQLQFSRQRRHMRSIACRDPTPSSAVHEMSLPFPEFSIQCLCILPQAPTMTFDNVFMFLTAHSFSFRKYLCYKYMLMLPDTGTST